MAETPPSVERRISGRALVFLVGGASAAVGGVVLLLALLVGSRTDVDVACEEAPVICATVREFAQALNERDAEQVMTLLTEQGLPNVLEVESAEELADELRARPQGDIIEQLQITSISIDGDRAEVRARFLRLNLRYNDAYLLVRNGDGWLIDGVVRFDDQS